MMESHEVLREAVKKVGAKRVAAEIEVSTSLVYKWCEERSEDEEQRKSGARNPLDRIAALIRSTNDLEVIIWLCQQADGFFVENPEPGLKGMETQYFSQTQQLISDFSELLAIMSESIRNDGKIDPEEARRIRDKWEALKRYGEHFVTACEHGEANQRDDNTRK